MDKSLVALALLAFAACSPDDHGSEDADTSNVLDVRLDDSLIPADAPGDLPDTSQADQVDDENGTDNPCNLFGCSCSSNAGCLDGLCIEGADGYMCTKLCQVECPEDFDCLTTTAFGPDPMSICVPRNVRLCRPCMSDDDCASPLAISASHCLPASEPGAGNFCGSPCDNGLPCPGGFACKSIVLDNGALSKQCQRIAGVCECRPSWADKPYRTTCAITDEAGSCIGTRGCGPSGLTSCVSGTLPPQTCAVECDGEAGGGSCDDGLACTEDTCGEDDICSHVQVPGTCRVDGFCWEAGQVRPGFPCQQCSPDLSAVAWSDATGTACDDGDPCTSSDTCNAGECGGTISSCDDGIACTFDSCIATGCVHDNANCACAVDADCDDNDACTGVEICAADGTCQRGSPIECEPELSACYDNVCEPRTGSCNLVAKPDGTSCADTDLCDGAEICHSGNCEPGTAIDCGDGDPCNGIEVCEDGNCLSGTPVDCSAVADSCLQKICNQSSGKCDLPALDGTPCDDGDSCTSFSECNRGKCEPVSLVLCEQPSDVCEVAFCLADTGGCVNSPIAPESALQGPGDLAFFRHNPVRATLDFVGSRVKSTGPTVIDHSLHSFAYDGSFISSSVVLTLTSGDSRTVVRDSGSDLLIFTGSEPPDVAVTDYDGQVIQRHTVTPLPNLSSAGLRDAVRRTDGGFVCIGSVLNTISQKYDIWLVWLDANGALERQIAIDRGGTERGLGVALHPDGGYLVQGIIGVPDAVFPADNVDVWFGRINEIGSLVSETRRPLGFNAWAERLIPVNSGSFITFGNGQWGPAGRIPSILALILIVDKFGAVTSEFRYGEDGIDDSHPLAVLPLQGGGFLVGGLRSDYQASGVRGFVIRASDDGTVIWEKEYSNPPFWPNEISVLRPGAYVLSGRLNGNPGWRIIDGDGELCGSGGTP